MTVLPGTSSIRQLDTHRLVPQVYSDEPYAVLERIAPHPEDLAAIAELDRATDKQAYAENNLLPGVGMATWSGIAPAKGVAIQDIITSTLHTPDAVVQRVRRDISTK